MNRRTLMTSMLAAGASTTAATAAAAAPAPAVPRVVYHLSDLDKAQFVLGNLRNHIDGMGGPENVSLAVVIHGPPLRLFRADRMVRSGAERLAKQGVAFFACANTMKAMELTLGDLPAGFAVAERGGVVKLAELQGDGWLYLRP